MRLKKRVAGAFLLEYYGCWNIYMLRIKPRTLKTKLRGRAGYLKCTLQLTVLSYVYENSIRVLSPNIGELPLRVSAPPSLA